MGEKEENPQLWGGLRRAPGASARLVADLAAAPPVVGVGLEHEVGHDVGVAAEGGAVAAAVAVVAGPAVLREADVAKVLPAVGAAAPRRDVVARVPVEVPVG